MEVTTSLSGNSDLLEQNGAREHRLPPKYSNEQAPIPISFVPTPTQAFREHRKMLRALVQPGMPQHPAVGAAAPQAIPIPIPLPFLVGARVLMWKQDPSVNEIGVRKVFLPGHVFAGPTDARIRIEGLSQVVPNSFGDLIATPGTDAFDAVHAFAVVRQTLTMYQRAKAGAVLPWEWNTGGNTDPLHVFPHAGVTMNAFYSRSDKALKFFFFDTTSPPPQHTVFTCRSLDIVAHETGHAVLDGLQPHWLEGNNPPQTGGLHESFGDLTAIFLTLSQFDQVEAIIAQTKANLHDKTFLSDLAEQFGLALGRPNGLRNADNDFTLSQVGTEVHAISQVFTGAIYDILADIFAFERQTALRDDATTLYQVGQYMLGLVLRALIASPATAATFVDVANHMLSIAFADGKPVQYRNFIRNRFTVRQVIVSPVPLSQDHDPKHELKAGITDPKGATQDRQGCCGTMTHPQYRGSGAGETDDEFERLKKAASGKREKRVA